jgi:uncharacterized protein (TIGR03437 family)
VRNSSSLCNIRLFTYVIFGVIFLATTQTLCAQGTLGANLIVNPGAEAGTAGVSISKPTTSIPGWTITGGANVLPYDLTGLLLSTGPAPADHGFNYFVAPSSGVGATGTLTQDINVSSLSSMIANGNVKFSASAYLGSANGSGIAAPSQVAFAFKNGNGQTFSTVTVGPLGLNGNGMSQQQQVGLVPVGTVDITVTLTLNTRCENAAQCSYSAADSLSLVLTALSTSPGMVLGTNLIANPGAETGASVAPGSIAQNVPGWSTANGASVTPYGGSGWIGLTDPGPADRGVNLFSGFSSSATSYQDLDVSGATTLIDAGQVTYQVSAWLGGTAGVVAPTLTYQFFDWSGKQLAATAQFGGSSLTHGAPGLAEAAASGMLPAGTRRVHIGLAFTSTNAMADDIAFTLAAPSGPPVVSPGGIVSASAFGAFTSIAPGSWIEIYGSDLAASTGGWSGTDFNNGIGPTTLGGVTVSVGGQPAFIDYVSPGQIDALVPSNAPTGAQAITITNANGASDKFWLIVNPTQPGLLAPPTFTVSGKQYVAAILSDGSFALPLNAIPGVASRPAHAGETVTIYGVGFGAVSGGLTAGTIVTQQNSLTTPLQFTFNTTSVTPAYDGLAPSFTGLYQFNLVVPSAGVNNALPISFTLGGSKGSQTLYIAVQN